MDGSRMDAPEASAINGSHALSLPQSSAPDLHWKHNRVFMHAWR